MEVVKISREYLENVRNSSEDLFKKELFCEYPYLFYIEIDNDSILLFIKHGKYYNYFTHAEVIFPKELVLNTIKMVKKYNSSELTLKQLKQTLT